MSKLIMSAFLLMGLSGSLSHAQVGGVIEGRLVAKFEGELDPMVLGDGCAAVVDYYREGKGLQLIVIYQPQGSGPCFTDGAQINEEFDFVPATLKKITNPSVLESLRDLFTVRRMGKKISGYYSMKPAVGRK